MFMGERVRTPTLPERSITMFGTVGELMKLVWSVLVLAACSVDIDYERTTLAFEPASPPKPGGGDSPMVASGTTILTNGYITWDDGATWRQKNPAVDTQYPQIWNDENLLVFTTAFGWGRWVRSTDQVGSIDPPFMPAAIHLSKYTGSIIIQSGGTRTMARQTAAGAWSQSTLPDPPAIPPTGFALHDILATPDAVFAITSWGLYRSGDDGASWGWVNDPAIPNGPKFLELPDHRVAILTGQFNQIVNVFDSNGTLQNISSPQFPPSNSLNNNERFRAYSCLGAIVNNSQYSTDLGMTWKPLLPAIPNVSWTVDKTTCGGDYIAIHITQPVSWLVKMTTLEQLDFLYTFPVNAGGGGSLTGQYMRGANGTVFAEGLAWKPGDATWRIRLLPPNVQIYSLADGSLYGVDVVTVYRSTDDGLTWTETMVPMAPPGFDRVFSDPAGTYWASLPGPTTTADSIFRAKLYKSTDKGITWTTVSEMAPRLAAIARDGTFVATTGGTDFHVSRDQGATWSTAEPFPSGYNFLMLSGNDNGISYDANDGPKDRDEHDADPDPVDYAPSFHVWDDYGAGNALRQVTPLVPALDPMTMEMTHLPADLGPVKPTMSVDAESYVWWYGGTPQQGAWRSLRPID